MNNNKELPEIPILGALPDEETLTEMKTKCFESRPVTGVSVVRVGNTRIHVPPGFEVYIQ